MHTGPPTPCPSTNPYVIWDPTRPPLRHSEGSEPTDPALAFTLIILGCLFILLPATYYGLSYIYRGTNSSDPFDDIEFVTIDGEIVTETDLSDHEEQLD